MPIIAGGDAHRQRQAAESFGVDPARYDRTRPRYPASLVELIAGHAVSRSLGLGTDPAPRKDSRGCSTSPGGPPAPCEALDVGTGTGIVARQLLDAGCTVLGVEPDPRMAAFARDSGVPVEVSTFETWDPAGRTFDAVVAGQTWHWVDPSAGAAKAAEVLRPGGRIAVFWNVAQPPADLFAASREAYAQLLPDSPMAKQPAMGPNAYDALCEHAADGLRRTGSFTEPELLREDWQQTYTRAEWLDLIPTQGLHTTLPPSTLDRLLAAIGAATGDAFTMRYTTVTVTATKLRT